MQKLRKHKKDPAVGSRPGKREKKGKKGKKEIGRFAQREFLAPPVDSSYYTTIT